ncbi:hypothetical protein SGUI_1236 [Serinicoccus hydrothermalis]|uniref:Uncharacterized protein n=1 Tax=Serinicoccus hydrothermalis TaxID=1758689 RepID=A0A1B1NB31_9MICO|nr:hypothetical protein SGUI_1236 [Serinicoccus hydrothermalis]
MRLATTGARGPAHSSRLARTLLGGAAQAKGPPGGGARGRTSRRYASGAGSRPPASRRPARRPHGHQ